MSRVHSPSAHTQPGSAEGSSRDVKIGPWRIWFDPPPIGTRVMDWHYQHEDCDGPESPAWMAGSCASFNGCVEDILMHYEERGS